MDPAEREFPAPPEPPLAAPSGEEGEEPPPGDLELGEDGKLPGDDAANAEPSPESSDEPGTEPADNGDPPDPIKAAAALLQEEERKRVVAFKQAIAGLENHFGMKLVPELVLNIVHMPPRG